MIASHFIEKMKIYGIKQTIIFVISEIENVLKQKVLHSYSQKGEDLFIDKLLKNKKRGFYVDIGAGHPKRFSNTYHFYIKGWQGITVDPDHSNAVLHKNLRPRDIFLEYGVSKNKGLLTFYQFEPSTLSTFSKKQASFCQKMGYQLLSTKKISIERLSSIIKKHTKGRIDLLSIDTEGHEMEVLESNDWNRFKPTVICIECYDFTSENKDVEANKKVINFLTAKGYRLVLDNKINCIFTF